MERNVYLAQQKSQIANVCKCNLEDKGQIKSRDVNLTQRLHDILHRLRRDALLLRPNLLELFEEKELLLRVEYLQHSLALFLQAEAALLRRHRDLAITKSRTPDCKVQSRTEPLKFYPASDCYFIFCAGASKGAFPHIHFLLFLRKKFLYPL